MVFCEECCNIYKKQGCYLSSPKEHSWLFVCPELCTSSDWNIFCRTFIGMYASLTAQSQLACDGFAISLRLISRHFRPGPHGTPLRLPGQFWESGGHQVTFNLDLKPGAAFLIAFWSPINRSIPGRCLVGRCAHRAGAEPHFRQRTQSIYQSDTAQTPAGPGHKISQTSLATRQTHFI